MDKGLGRISAGGVSVLGHAVRSPRDGLQELGIQHIAHGPGFAKDVPFALVCPVVGSDDHRRLFRQARFLERIEEGR